MSHVILMYHRISHRGDFFRLGESLVAFVEQMEYIRSRCNVLPLEEIGSSQANGQRLQRAVSVTFDDGYVDTLPCVPIMSALDIPATFFMTTEQLGVPLEFWWDTLTRLVLDEPVLPPTLDTGLETVPPLPVRTIQEREVFVTTVHTRIRHLSVNERNDVLTRLAGQIGPTTAVAAHRMTANQVVEIASIPGISIGAHTTHHLSLPSHPPDVQRDEMLESRSTLESLIGRAVESVAYPFGEATRETVQLARDLGFRDGVVVSRAPEPGFERLTMGRVDAPTMGARFAERLGDAFARSEAL